MAKKVAGEVKLQLVSGQATPATAGWSESRPLYD